MKIIDTPKFITDLDEIKPERSGIWELNIFYDHPDGHMVGKSTIELMTCEEMINSTIDLTFVQGSRIGPPLRTDLDGQMSKMAIQFSLYITDRDWLTAPFICTGTSLSSEEKYEGRWHVSCQSPEKCGEDCEGVEGKFSLTKIS